MFLCLSTKVCDVFRNRGLPSSYDGQLRAMVIACFVLEATGALGQKQMPYGLSLMWILALNLCEFGLEYIGRQDTMQEGRIQIKQLRR